MFRTRKLTLRLTLAVCVLVTIQKLYLIFHQQSVFNSNNTGLCRRGRNEAPRLSASADEIPVLREKKTLSSWQLVPAAKQQIGKLRSAFKATLDELTVLEDEDYALGDNFTQIEDSESSYADQLHLKHKKNLPYGSDFRIYQEIDFLEMMNDIHVGTTKHPKLDLANIKVFVDILNKALPVSEYKRWKAKEFTKEIANPSVKSVFPPQLRKYPVS